MQKKILTVTVLSIFSCYTSVLAMQNEDIFSSALTPHKKRLHWESQHKPSKAVYSSDLTLSANSITQGIKKLSAEQLPWENSHYVYYLDKDGTFSELMQYTNSTPTMSICIYGPNPDGNVNYVGEDLSYGKESKRLRHSSAFAWTKKKGYGGNRKEYPIDTYAPVHGFSMDRGHGIDFIITIDEDNHSSRDHKNYTPQNSVYNQQIRKDLVGNIRKNGGNFVEIPIYTSHPETIEHTVPKKYSSTGKVEKYQIDVPIGFLFIEKHKGSDRKMFYFPNFIDYKSIKKTNNSSYIDLSALFELEEISLHGAQFDGFKANTYSPNLSVTDIDQDIHKKSFIGYRLLSGRYQLQYKKDKISKEFIPKEAHQALVRTIALRQLDHMAENEFTSVEYKLSLIKTFLNDFKIIEIGQNLYDPERARTWFKRAKKQVEYESTVDEKLDLLAVSERSELQGLLDREELLKKIQVQAIKNSTIYDKWQLVDLFQDQEQKKFWLQKIEKQIKDHFLKGIEEEDALCEKLNLADCYAFGERGARLNPLKAVKLYREIRKAKPRLVDANYFKNIALFYQNYSLEWSLFWLKFGNSEELLKRNSAPKL